MAWMVQFGISHLPASTLILNLSDHYRNHQGSWAWWHTPIIPVFGSLRQEDGGFEASLSDTLFQKLKKKKKYVSTLTCESGRAHLSVEVVGMPWLPEKWFLRPGFLRQTCDTQRGKGFWDETTFKNKYLVSVLGIFCHPSGCSVNQRVANMEPQPFEPVLNPIIAQMYRAIFKGEKWSKIYIKVM